MSQNPMKEQRNLLVRIMQHPVAREDFVTFCYWPNKDWELYADKVFKKEGLYREPKSRWGRRENFVRAMMKKGFISCGRKTNILRVTKKGLSWIHRFDADEMAKQYGNVSHSTAGLLSFGC